MRRIARDETRHAALSWRVARWLDTRLDSAAKRNVEQAREQAARELEQSLANEPARPFAALAGLPTPAQAAALARRMTHALWS